MSVYQYLSINQTIQNIAMEIGPSTIIKNGGLWCPAALHWLQPAALSSVVCGRRRLILELGCKICWVLYRFLAPEIGMVGSCKLIPKTRCLLFVCFFGVPCIACSISVADRFISSLPLNTFWCGCDMLPRGGAFWMTRSRQTLFTPRFNSPARNHKWVVDFGDLGYDYRNSIHISLGNASN